MAIDLPRGFSLSCIKAIDERSKRLNFLVVPPVPIKHVSHPLKRVVTRTEAKLVLDSVSGGQVADVVEERPQPDECFLCRGWRRTWLPMLGKREFETASVVWD